MSKARRRLALGLCITCGGFPRSLHSTRICESCRLRRNTRIQQERAAHKASRVVGQALAEPSPDREVWVDGHCFQVVFDGRQGLSSPEPRHIDWVRYGAEI
jgi:hypothetical protein